MKKLMIGLTITAVLVLTVASVAFADSDSPLYPGGRGPGNGGRPGGMVGPADGSGVLHDYIISAMADAFGISEDELNARLEDGERMYDIATSLGLSQEEFFQAMSEARTAAMEQAYADGLITQEQYEFFLDRGGRGQMGGGFEGRGGHGGGGFGGECPYTESDS